MCNMGESERIFFRNIKCDSAGRNRDNSDILFLEENS